MAQVVMALIAGGGDFELPPAGQTTFSGDLPQAGVTPLAPDLSAIAPSAIQPSAGVNAAPGQFVHPYEGEAPVGAEPGQQFGAARDSGSRSHGGVDIGLPQGSSVLAATSGTVTAVAAPTSAAYSYIEITSPDGIITRYGHLSAADIPVGTKVSAGQLIGRSGGAPGTPGSGGTTGPHLHFEVNINGQNVDPTPYLIGGASVIADKDGDPFDAQTLATKVTVTYSPEQAAAPQLANVVQAAMGQKPTHAATPEVNVERQGLPGQGEAVSTEGGPAEWVREAMRITGVPDDWFEPLMARMQQESGGDPRAINEWDVNARNGTPSKGLFQTIDPTFQSYKMEGLDDIWNPVHNAVAAIRYMIARYGSVFNLPKGGY